MKGFERNIILLLTVMLASKSIAAQVLVKTSVDKDKILVGEPIRLTVEAHVPLGEKITWFRLDTIAHFDILDTTRLQSDDDIDGKKLQQQWTITSFDSGRWEIPRLPVQVGTKTFYSDTVGVQIAYAPYDLSQDYHDIKDIHPVAAPRIDYLPWLIGATVLVAILIIVLLWYFRRKRIEQKVPVPKLTPFEEAMKSLTELRRLGWEQNGQVKVFYTRLNDILRVFVLRRLNMTTMEKTNDELILQLKGYNLKNDQYIELVQALRMADFVKFAQYRPASDDNEKSFGIIKSAITTLDSVT
jgi:hypothetical protein